MNRRPRRSFRRATRKASSGLGEARGGGAREELIRVGRRVVGRSAVGRFKTPPYRRGAATTYEQTRRSPGARLNRRGRQATWLRRGDLGRGRLPCSRRSCFTQAVEPAGLVHLGPLSRSRGSTMAASD